MGAEDGRLGRDAPMDHQLRDLLTTFHSVMPGVAGVVLSDAAGRSVAADVATDVDAHHLATQGRANMDKGCSALVDHCGALYLVVLMPT